MDSLRFASLSRRAALIRLEEASEKEIDIAPLHLLDWNPVHAVSTAVTESRTTAMISRQSAWRSLVVPLASLTQPSWGLDALPGGLLGPDLSVVRRSLESRG